MDPWRPKGTHDGIAERAPRQGRHRLLHRPLARGRRPPAPDLPTQEGAEAWQRRAEDIEQAQRLGQPLASPTQALRRTLTQEWPRFIERRQAEVAASTVDKHQWAYRSWIEPVLGHRKLGTITPEDLRGVLELARRAGKDVDTRIAIYQTVNMLLDSALGRDGHRCRVDVTVGTSTRGREINVLTDPELDRLIAATPARHRLLVDFLATMERGQ